MMITYYEFHKYYHLVKSQFDVIKLRVKKQRYSPLLLVCSDVGLV